MFRMDCDLVSAGAAGARVIQAKEWVVVGPLRTVRCGSYSLRKEEAMGENRDFHKEQSQAVQTAIDQIRRQVVNLQQEKVRATNTPRADSLATAITDLKKTEAYLKTFCLEEWEVR